MSLTYPSTPGVPPATTGPGGGGGGGPVAHSSTTGRSSANQHPIAAITGLQEALDAVAGARYFAGGVATNPWAQGDGEFTATGNVYGVIVPSQDPYYRVATFHFRVEAAVVGADGTGGAPRLNVDVLFRTLDPSNLAGWAWGLNYGDPLRVPVYGQLGGLPFAGYADQSDNLLDADGVPITRTIQTGDYLCGTVTGVFQND